MKKNIIKTTVLTLILTLSFNTATFAAPFHHGGYKTVEHVRVEKRYNHHYDYHKPIYKNNSKVIINEHNTYIDNHRCHECNNYKIASTLAGVFAIGAGIAILSAN